MRWLVWLYFCLPIYAFCSPPLFLDCSSYSLDCGPDFTICEGDSETLIPFVNSGTGEILSYNWSPASGLDATDILNPMASPTTTTNYTLEVEILTGANLLTNGDFESGNTGFTTAYGPATGGAWGPLSNEGTYTIDSNSGNTHNNFSNCSDHTGGGDMMVVNGSSTLNLNIWCQTVTVEQNTDYQISLWLQSVHPNSPAQAQFTINGVALGSVFGASSSTCQWEQFFESWNSGSAVTANICITNQNTSADGNDFAIDDIAFVPICRISDDVTVIVATDQTENISATICEGGFYEVNGQFVSTQGIHTYNTNTWQGCDSTINLDLTVIDIVADINFPDMLSCANGLVTLNGFNSSTGNNISYQWTTTTGNFAGPTDDISATVDQPGYYELLVTYDDGFVFCSDNFGVTVQLDPLAPDADAGADAILDCFNTTLFLSGNDNSSAVAPIYNWTTVGGNILSGNDTPSPLIDQPGFYILEIYHTNSGCSDFDTLEVVENQFFPVANGGADETLICQMTSLVLDGTGSSLGSDYTFFWSTDSGNILTGETTSSPEVDAAGNYFLQVQNTLTGCISFDTVWVDIDQVLPSVIIAQPDTLTCIDTILVMDGTGSSIGTEFNYQWTTANGNILSADTLLNATINQAGDYNLEITNINNNCVSSFPVSVVENRALPDISIDDPDILNCTDTITSLSANNLSGMGGYGFQWTSANGSILNGDISLNPEVNAAGIYVLESVDLSSGCKTQDSITVLIDTLYPQINIAPAEELNCQVIEVSLDATNSSQGLNYNWTTPQGNILSGAAGLQPVINQPGDYYLEITNMNNGCVSVESIPVQQDTAVPVIQIAPSQNLNCADTILQLDGSSSSSGIDFLYNWSSDIGNILSGENSASPEIDAPGIYYFEITDTSNLCVNLDSVEVTENGVYPMAQIEMPGELDCADSTTILNAGNSSVGINFIYNWITTDGLIISGNNSLMPLVGEVGNYTLQITDTSNSCISYVSTFVDGDTVKPDIQVALPGLLTCSDSLIALDASASSNGSEFIYNWTSFDGNILSGEDGLQPIVNQPGSYNLEITNSINSCVSVAMVSVLEDVAFPISQIELADTLTCTDIVIQINAENSSQGADFSYVWNSQNGNIISGINTLTPEVDQPGEYGLAILNINNNCESFSTVTVLRDTVSPLVQVEPAPELNCLDTLIQLDGTNSSFGNEYSYNWTTTNGFIVSGENAPMPSINSPGNYLLEITNINNGCVSSAPVTVSENIDLPEINIITPSILTCEDTVITLSGMGSSSGNEFEYLWQTNTGQIELGETTLNPEVSAAGSYILTISNINNGCVSQESILVSEDVSLPFVEVEPADSLTCVVTELNLNSGNSDQGNNYIYNWITPNGNILSGQSSEQPLINAAGDYILEITNTNNGCVNSASIEVPQSADVPEVIIQDADTLNCLIDQLTLDALNSTQGNGIVFSWTTTQGNILSGATSLQPEVNAPGTYNLEITNTNNQCVSVGSIVVPENIVPPNISFNSVPALNCQNSQVQIDATNSSMGVNFVYDWTTFNGNILSGQNGTSVQTNAPGFYYLEITNTNNGCANLDSIEVAEDVVAPIANIAAPDTLDCVQTQQTLSGSSNGNYFYVWSTSNGNIVTGDSSLQAQVDQPGIYYFTVTNLDNYCSALDTVTVVENVEYPVLNIQNPGILNCQATSLQLNAAASSQGSTFEYQWETITGNIQSGQNSTQPEINEPGIYYLEIINTNNQCVSVDSIEVLQDIAPPIIEIAEPDSLDCQISNLILDASNSEQGSGYTYQWSTGQGSILSGATTLMPAIQAAGYYYLEITNTNNFCSIMDSIEVVDVSDAPVVEILPPNEITCVDSIVTLDAGNSSQGGAFSFIWQTQNGSFLSGQNSLTPNVDQSGFYILEITNNNNDCVSNDTVEVVSNTISPNSSLVPPGDLTCAILGVTLVSEPIDSLGIFYEYEWNTLDGNIQTTFDNQALVDEPGNYSLTITNSQNGCTQILSTEVFENRVYPVAEAGADQDLGCTSNVQTELNGLGSSSNGDYSYVWTPVDGTILDGQGTLQPLVEGTGWYLLLVVDDENGCARVDSVRIEAFPPLIGMALESISPTCVIEGEIQVAEVEGGVEPFSYNINASNYTNNPVFGNLEPGDYEVFVQDGNGCITTQEISLPDFSPVEIFLEPEATINYGETYPIFAQVNLPQTNIDSFYWLESNTLSCQDCLDPVASPGQTTVYEIVALDNNGCVAEAQIRINVFVNKDIFIPNIFSPGNLDGENDKVTVFGNSTTVAQINSFSIFNRWGEQVFKQENFPPNDNRFGWDGSYNGKSLNPGVFVYIAEVKFVDGSTSILSGDITLMR